MQDSRFFDLTKELRRVRESITFHPLKVMTWPTEKINDKIAFAVLVASISMYYALRPVFFIIIILRNKSNE